MKCPPKNLGVFIFGAFLAAGIFCSTMAAPRQAAASLSGCAGMRGEMTMRGCENPHYLCGFGSPRDFLARGALSAPAKDSFKNALALDLGALGVNGTAGRTFLGASENAFFIELRKVSIRLFNSTLNL